ncbi:MAG: amidophosphoribosyltransferase [Phycisphaerales bacterium]
MVSDTSPINYLVLLDKVDLLRQLFGSVVVPPFVMTELQDARSPEAIRAWAASPPAWIQVRRPSGTVAGRGIHAGESEAIALAIELRADAVLIDDSRARRFAQARGLVVKGTLGILKLAADRNLVDLNDAVNQLRAGTFRSRPELLERLLRRDPPMNSLGNDSTTTEHDSPNPREKCGVFAAWAEPHPARLAYFALYALQHRGQESAGIAVTNGSSIERHADMGLVAQVFDSQTLARLDAHAHSRKTVSNHHGPESRATKDAPGGAIAHNRYSTTGASSRLNAQPFTCFARHGSMAIGHNGNIVNAAELRLELEDHGHVFNTSSDTEVILQLVAHCDKGHPPDRSADPLAEALKRLRGAFSLVFLYDNRVEVARDPWGWRPLVLGRGPHGGHVVASETVAIEVIGGEVVREIEPGEIVTLDDSGVHARRFSDPAPRQAPCVFEHVYFASPASTVFGVNVQTARERMGETLAREAPAPSADLVMPMPDSGRSAAMGFARASGLPYREGIIPNRYVGRTFIKPTGEERAIAVRLKLNIVPDVVRGKRVVVVDDSIVRGTTTRSKMEQLRAAGTAEIHLRISCPPIRHPCYFGVDFPSKTELVAHNRDVEQIRQTLGVDSLAFLSKQGLLDAVHADHTRPGAGHCTACYDGDYPIDIGAGTTKEALTRG